MRWTVLWAAGEEELDPGGLSYSRAACPWYASCIQVSGLDKIRLPVTVQDLWLGKLSRKREFGA
ncbi:hypothetical protein GJ744_005350 [Endocarpon pusillum]|uniref:Uncharacterized protein n=1 Tax=Endocarpon pusillum TaxID=364733 RepID=A0A8H7E5E8_9EURO|nr:hypothetical protein GJ744_005350 [Endocarpon pusillum]